MRLAIVYDTKTGNTAKMAEYLIEGFTAVDGAEAKAFPITAVDEEKQKISLSIRALLEAPAEEEAAEEPATEE